MPSPVATDLLASFEVGTDGTNVYKTWNNPTPSNQVTTTLDAVQAWAPLAQGNSCGSCGSAAGTTNACVYVANDFANGLGGIKGGAHALNSAVNLIALGDFDVWAVMHANGAPSNNARLLDTGFGSGFMIMANGTTAGSYVGGILSSSPPYGEVVSATDVGSAAHIFHLFRRGAVGTLEVDGHTVTDSSYAVAATQLAAAQLFLFGTTTDGASTWSMGTVYIYGRTTAYGGQTSGQVNQIFNYLGPRYSITLSGVGASGGYRKARGLTAGLGGRLKGGF